MKSEIKLAGVVGFELFKHVNTPIVLLYQLKKTMAIEKTMFQKMVNFVNDFHSSKYVCLFESKQILAASFLLSFDATQAELTHKNWPSIFQQTNLQTAKISFLLSRVYTVEKADPEKVCLILKDKFASNHFVNLTTMIGSKTALLILGRLIRQRKTEIERKGTRVIRVKW